jgi:hypothetical protein
VRQKIYRRLAVASSLVVLSLAGPAHGATKVSVTRTSVYDPTGLHRVAVVTADCHEQLNCREVENAAIVALTHAGRTVVAGSLVHEWLLSAGHTHYEPELRQEILEHFDLDAVLELSIPHADRSRYTRSSQVKVEVAVVSGSGAILAHGSGTGRPLNRVSGPERVAGNVVEDLVGRMFGE